MPDKDVIRRDPGDRDRVIRPDPIPEPEPEHESESEPKLPFEDDADER